MMNEKREDYNAILFISIILLAVGFVAAVYFLFKKENKLALEYFLAGLLGVAIEVVMGLISHCSLLTSLVPKGNVLFTTLGAFLVFGFLDRFNWKWVGLVTLIFSVMLVLLPLVHLKNMTDTFFVIPQLLMTLLIDMLIADKMNRWVALTIDIIGGLIWGLLLIALIGLIY